MAIPRIAKVTQEFSVSWDNHEAHIFKIGDTITVWGGSRISVHLPPISWDYRYIADRSFETIRELQVGDLVVPVVIGLDYRDCLMKESKIAKKLDRDHWRLENNSIVAPEWLRYIDIACSCSLAILMLQGCQCGAFRKEVNSRA